MGELVPDGNSADEGKLELRRMHQLLMNAVEYMERLPRVPMTVEMCQNLPAQLQSKPQRLAATLRDELRGQGPFTPAGMPLLEATLGEDRVLTVMLATGLQGATRRQALDKVMEALSAGGTLELRLDSQVVARESRATRKVRDEPS